jgi:hypothetical protein
MRQLLDGLSVSEVEESESLQNRVSRLTASSVTWSPSPSARPRKLRSVLIAGVSVLLFGWFGWQLLTTSFHGSNAGFSDSASPLPTNEISQGTGAIADVVKVTIYDPLGDNTENDGQVLLAVDSDKGTAWTTDRYQKADMSGKAGVGLLLDLGVIQDVYGIDLDVISGQKAAIYVVNSTEPDLATQTKFADIGPNESSSSFGASPGVSGRYVLIWLTPDLPVNDTGEFQGGISEVKVRL